MLIKIILISIISFFFIILSLIFLFSGAILPGIVFLLIPAVIFFFSLGSLSISKFLYPNRGNYTYLLLEDDYLKIIRGLFNWSYPRIYYSKIKSVKFNDKTLYTLDTGATSEYPLFATLEEPEKFLDDLKNRYKKSTGKILKIINQKSDYYGTLK